MSQTEQDRVLDCELYVHKSLAPLTYEILKVHYWSEDDDKVVESPQFD